MERHGERAAIVDFVEAVAGDGPDVVPPEQRVAVFDNDGTLWTEKPMPTQLHYIVKKWREQMAADPSLAERQPYQAVASGDLAWLGRAIDKHYTGDDSDLRLIIKEILQITANYGIPPERVPIGSATCPHYRRRGDRGTDAMASACTAS